MTFEYAGNQYRIIFQHGKYSLPRAPTVIFRGTRCRIEKVGGDLFTESYSYCHPKDNFCRETGRKLALKKALSVRMVGSRVVYQPREFRAAAWNAEWGVKNTSRDKAADIRKAEQRILAVTDAMLIEKESGCGVLMSASLDVLYDAVRDLRALGWEPES